MPCECFQILLQKKTKGKRANIQVKRYTPTNARITNLVVVETPIKESANNQAIFLGGAYISPVVEGKGIDAAASPPSQPTTNIVKNKSSHQ
jgi:hypothetical protein